ncbi:peptidase family M41-domain-containing protein [Globomyces pollinis-pini]|nr:peptidase family M41-domain-containing protein [Globomyces pollinis-pini]
MLSSRRNLASHVIPAISSYLKIIPLGSISNGRLKKLYPLTVPSRSFFTEQRLLKLEMTANENAKDPVKQRPLYKELIASAKYRTCISRYESQPQLPPPSIRYSAEQRQKDAFYIQSDPVILESYITALVLAGKQNKISEKLGPIIQGQSIRPSEVHEPTVESQILTPNTEPREHWMKTNRDQWQRAIDRQNPNSAFASAHGGLPTPNDGPIQVVLSEAWSWSKFSRSIGSKIIFGVLIMTALSVVLDQQGVLKGGMNNSEVEPLSTGTTIRFDDVQGVDEAKHELEEVVAFLKEPSKFMELGGKLPKGILLHGPPGTGKTHLARAVAGEAGVPFFQMSGSEFDELYVGVGARRVRELFAAAKKKAPCIIFIDELDAVGSKRSMKDQSYMRQTLNQLLVEMDGFNSSSGVILIAATNTPESLDKALVRPGRFDRLVPVPLPDVKGRTQILKVHMKDVTFGLDVNPEIISRGTPGFSGADLANLVNQAAIKASKESARFVNMSHLEWAKDKILMGAERKSAVITPESKEMTAYHEGGHTLVALYTKGAMPLHKVTVIPRGNALGLTMMLPEADQTSQTREQLLASLDVAMGGRVAEELIYGAQQVTTGASNDLQNATHTARAMVLHYGMSDKVGLISWSDEEFARASPATKATIEDEIKQMLDESYSRVTKLLKQKDRELHALAVALVEQETLDLNEVKQIIENPKSVKK